MSQQQAVAAAEKPVLAKANIKVSTVVFIFIMSAIKTGRVIELFPSIKSNIESK